MSLTRREIFGALGITAGFCALPSCARQELKSSRPKTTGAQVPWPYERLDPDATAERAYACYHEGHCMYAVFRGIIGQLAERHGEPYRSFPFGMMSYGAGGVAGWGSLCGALNGAAAAIALVAPTNEQRTNLTSRVFLWYEQTALPAWAPARPRLDVPLPASVAHSVLCHISVSAWCQVSGYPVAGREQMERCARLASEVARQTVIVVNDGLPAGPARTPDTHPQVGRCNTCHGPGSERKDALARMTCTTCHDSLGDKHPSLHRTIPSEPPRQR